MNENAAHIIIMHMPCVFEVKRPKDAPIELPSRIINWTLKHKFSNNFFTIGIVV